MDYNWIGSGLNNYRTIRTADFGVIFVVFCGKCGRDFRVDDINEVDVVDGMYLCKPCFNDINTVKLTMWGK